MKVLKRNGHSEPVSFDKVTRRIELLCQGLTKEGDKFGPELKDVDAMLLSQKVISSITDGIRTEQLDDYAAETAASLVLESPGYGALASRIVISNMHKKTLGSFSDIMQFFYERKVNGVPAPMLDHAIYKIIQKNATRLNSAIDYHRDYRIDYFGFKTLEKSYLWRFKTDQHEFCERPQQMYMRVAVGIFQKDIDMVIKAYNYFSLGLLSPATPTLFNAGMSRPQLSSCFLLDMHDSLENIYDLLKETAMISKYAGGIGISISKVRAKSSIIRGTNGVSNGLLPMMRVYDASSVYVDQGGGKRKGSIAIYVEPWHPDIFDFLKGKLPHGEMNQRALNLHYGLWIPDLFMKRVSEAIDHPNRVVLWSLFCPDECSNLTETYCQEFEDLYHKYEREGRARLQINVMDLWQRILDSQKEVGSVYMLYKDACCYRSNQKSHGMLHSSNLCCEVLTNTSAEETSVCNLNSIPLGEYVKLDSTGKPFFDHSALAEGVELSTKLLNRVIDINYYPTEKGRLSNLRNRPIGIGVQGLADAFYLMRYSFESQAARDLNVEIFETIYYSALRASMELAKIYGPYETFAGSPASQGILQPDLWASAPNRQPEMPVAKFSGRWDWDSLKIDIQKHGLRNSLVTALMPTASTAQILGNVEAFECPTYNIYVRGVLSGEFIVCNKHLQKDLVARGLWTPEVRRQLIKYQGSVQEIAEIPEDLKSLYKTAFEVRQKTLIDLAAERGPFIDQSQSFNWFVKTPTNDLMTSMHLYTWKRGMKTGMYYLRRQAIHQAQQFTVTPETKPAISESSKVEKAPEEGKFCRLDDPDCLACQS